MDPFISLPNAERSRQLDQYLAFLKGRDGTPDVATRTLSNRKAYFDLMEANPIQWKGALDRDAFFRNLDRRSEPGLDPKLLWLLAAAKSNRGERFGVELALRKDLTKSSGDEMLRYIEYEELVHTHLLMDACKLFAIDVAIRPPPLIQQAMIRTMVALPDVLSQPLVLCGEVVGVVGFQVLLERCDVFAAEPEVEERVRSLVREILVDEMGHVIFNRACVGKLGLSVARRMLPTVARGLLRDVPEFGELAGGAEGFLDRVFRFDLGAAQLPSALSFAR